MRLNKSIQYKLNLGKDDSAITVFCTQITELIKALQLILSYIGEDKDIEVLHQYRVILRKIEALLIVFHDFVAKKLLLKMKTDSKALFVATGQLRDFDLLLKKIQQAQLKNKHPYSNIKLIEHIAAKRHEEFVQFLLTIQSAAFQNRIVHLQYCLNIVEQNVDGVSLHDFWPTLLKESLNKVHTAYKRLWKHKDDPHIHKLRKSLKQLRYCIELIGLIVKPREASAALSWLKEKQKLLGDYNDLHVQLGLLKEYERRDKHIKRILGTNDLSSIRPILPLSKSDWKILRKKLQTLLG